MNTSDSNPNLKLPRVTDLAARLSLTELGLGSLLHGLHIPFGGHALSINQGLMLSAFSAESENRFKAAQGTLEVSCISAVLKSLAPMGNTFGPMLSICMQGFLYSLGIFTFGKKLLGQMLALALLCIWAFVQPLITYGLIFGPRLLKDGKALVDYISKTWGIPEDSWIYFVLGLYILKVAIAFFLRFTVFSTYFERLTQMGAQILLKREAASQKQSVTSKLFRDLTRPLFLFSLLLTALFAFFAKENPATMTWIILRPIALGILVFLLLRTPLTYKTLEKICSRSKWGTKILKKTLESMVRMEQTLSLSKA